MKNLKIAVIGRSSAGKSAFIKSFSSKPEYINSVGKGQTTRSYAEYLFIINYNDDFPYVEAEIASSRNFCEYRLEQVSDKLNDLKGYTEGNAAWFKQQFDNKVFKERIKKILLYSNDFFNINEFLFLDQDIIEWSNNEFNELVSEISSIEKKETVSCEDDKDTDTKRKLEIGNILYGFFRKVYEYIIERLKSYYKETEYLDIDNNTMSFKFHIKDEETKKLFSWILKVDENTRSSLTGVISKVKVRSGMSDEYAKILKKLGLSNISFIDTYGLDHSDNISEKNLVERYHRIFNRDYPDISIVFFVEALHTGASNEFKRAIITLYEIKPEIMTYVVGTHIDENEKELIDKEEWLFSEDKKQVSRDKVPHLNGKVQDIVDNDTDFLAILLEQEISESMAKKRCDVMQRRFAPFCGDLDKTTGEIDYKKGNSTSIKALFTSIVEKEHLGDAYIQIDKIGHTDSFREIINKFSAIFIENVKLRFREIYKDSASRTRWKIRENLEQYILGFNGTTIDATWLRVLRDAFNITFTKQIQIDGKSQMLSDVLEIEGNSKVAFDEVLATFSPYLLRRICKKEDYIDAFADEINCSECANESKRVAGCIWNTFMNAATYEAFKNRDSYPRVIDWLNALHCFAENDKLNEEVAKQFEDIIIRSFIPICRQHNMRIASKKIKDSSQSYVDSKREIFIHYKENFDARIDRSEFYNKVNDFLTV